MADWWATQRVKQRLAIIQKLNTIDRRVKMAKGKGKVKAVPAAAKLAAQVSKAKRKTNRI